MNSILPYYSDGNGADINDTTSSEVADVEEGVSREDSGEYVSVGSASGKFGNGDTENDLAIVDGVTYPSNIYDISSNSSDEDHMS